MTRRLGMYALSIAIVTSVAPGLCKAQSVLTHHVREATQDGTAPLEGQLSATQNLQLVITLPLRNRDQLDQLLEDLYDPSNPGYRQFLTVEQFSEQFGPTQAEYDAAIDFARENGLTVVGTSPNRLNLQVSGPVANVEAAFHVNLRVYQHPTENRMFYAPDREPTTNLTFALWHISGLDNYSIPHPAGLEKWPENDGSSSNATTGSGPSASFLGSDMRVAYYGGSLTGSGQSVGLLEYYGTDLADLTTYFSNAKQTNSVPIALVSTDGTSTSCLDTKAGGDCDDTEQTLDMTQALGMAPGLSSLVMYVGSTDAAIFNAMATANPLNAQLSSSWTWNPADPSTDDPYFKEFAAQGQNLFQAAGDNKKWTTTGTASETYPADDVYVTSVGGTDLETNAAGGAWASETAWADSGGGISPHKYAIPSWQTAAAAGCASCSQSYRDGPDVSANANFTFYVCADQTTCTANNYGGTSFAAPMWAGYMALINQQSVANGNNTLGFINPSLYSIGASSSYGSDFHDITSGSNGYSATTGYDLATGWGSPNGGGLISALAGSSSTAGVITSPAPGSTLTAASTTFTWSAGTGGVTAYFLHIGTSPGGADLVNMGVGTSTSATVTLPTNGATIYVQLETHIGATVIENNNTYTEYAISGGVITSPTPGSTLTAASTTFTWSAGTGGVTAYFLHIGTSPGGADLVNIYLGTSTSATVTLPTNGATIYVQLETHTGGTVIENNNTYTEYAISGGVITSPAPGSTLTSASTTFTWSAGTGGVTAYFLHVGTSPGGADLVNMGVGTSTSATVTLPTNGATIYVQLETHTGGTVIENNNTYTEYAISGGVITSPAPGSTLTSASTTFTWSAGTGGVTAYFLHVGTSPGGADLVNMGVGTSTSATVTLPTNGATIYVQLETHTGGTVIENNNTYTEYAISGGVITSPAPGSTLTSASTTFTWSAGTGGVTAYFLHVGTSPGGADLVNMGVGTSTSATVTLPTNGATIYVQLETHIGATVIENNNTYTESQ